MNSLPGEGSRAYLSVAEPVCWSSGKASRYSVGIARSFMVIEPGFANQSDHRPL